MVSEVEIERMAERVSRLTGGDKLFTQSAGDAHADDQVIGGPPLGVIPREIWLEKRAAELSRAIYQYIDFGFIVGDSHDNIQKWIDELQDIWQLVDRDGRIF
jgi:hypothetical protein